MERTSIPIAAVSLSWLFKVPIPEDLRAHIPRKVSELIEFIGRRVSEIDLGSTKHKDRVTRERLRNLRKLSIVYSVISSELSKSEKALILLTNLGDFYVEMFKLISDLDPVELAEHYKSRKFIARRIFHECKKNLSISESISEVKEASRKCSGRIVSLLKRAASTHNVLVNALIEVSRMPTVSADELKVVIAGLPQVGKSTLVNKISTAKSKVGVHPFTTKDIVVGHSTLNDVRIVFIDVPGVLDRPILKRNVIEKKALIALRHLADLVIYLLDASPNSYYTLREQLNVLKEVMKVSGGRVIIAINKVDATPRERVEEAKEYLFKELNLREVLEISALSGLGLERLIDEVKSRLLKHRFA
ncbi:MAG: 50S ribosome-binding GTPase [Sulfolobales archaeon]|nr:50S ribosome-binding GTPase [Sulfolobales archaeon]